MYKLTVHEEGHANVIETDGYDLLLSVLRNADYDIYAPCGGNGTCGKCKVWIKGEGSVSSCVFPVMEDMEIVLPDRLESQILVDQHKYTVKLPLLPGDAVRLSNNPHGVAIDIGTTSVVFYLVDLITGVIVETRAAANPQASYGADVISRINYTAENKDGLRKLQSVIVQIISENLAHFIQLMGLSPKDIVKISISGNTTMLHLLLGVDPLPIALAPFRPAFTEAREINAEDLGLHIHQNAKVHTLPCISAYVGADIVAGLASINPSEKFHKYLFMDIGTNGELALVSDGKVLCCATAAGPAFEGANIQHGITAVEGAISKFANDGYQVIGDVRPIGICGSGLIDVAAILLETDLIDMDGLLATDFIVSPAEENGINENIVITQKDIRELQLAKSAIASGVNILLNKAGINHEELDAVFLAGGFGNYINIDNAMKIGMLSPQFKGKVISLGNTSGTGALLSLRSMEMDKLIDQLLSKAEHLELADEPEFAMEFAMNMLFEQTV
jgi:uncharacterized 2Fe-2S/4Fe-4S cluster protein (DUF4445 family)